MIKPILTKIFAIVGAALVLIPLLAPFFFGFVSLIEDGRFNFDYLMPAELGIVILIGAVLLLVTALWTRLYLKLIAGAIGVAFAILFIGQAIAVATGLASGETEPDGWQWALVLTSLAIFYLADAVVGVGGVLMTRRLFTKPAS